MRHFGGVHFHPACLSSEEIPRFLWHLTGFQRGQGRCRVRFVLVYGLGWVRVVFCLKDRAAQENRVNKGNLNLPARAALPNPGSASRTIWGYDLPMAPPCYGPKLVPVEVRTLDIALSESKLKATMCWSLTVRHLQVYAELALCLSLRQSLGQPRVCNMVKGRLCHGSGNNCGWLRHPENAPFRKRGKPLSIGGCRGTSSFQNLLGGAKWISSNHTRNLLMPRWPSCCSVRSLLLVFGVKFMQKSDHNWRSRWLLRILSRWMTILVDPKQRNSLFGTPGNIRAAGRGHSRSPTSEIDLAPAQSAR